MMSMQLLFIFTLITLGRSEWIDPFSINTEVDPAMKELLSSKFDGNYALILSHYKRYINLLLNVLKHDVETNVYKGRVNVELSSESYDFLKDFSKGKAMETDWREVDSILSKVFYKSAKDKVHDLVLTWKDHLTLTVYSYEFRIAVFILLITFLLYKISKTKFGFKDIVKYLLLFIFLVDFGFTYIRLIQEKEVENFADSMKFSSAPECNPKKMSPMQYLGYLTSTTDHCKHYYKLQYVDILWVVNPLKVVGNQFHDLVVIPANGLGTAFGKFTNALLDNMSWYMAPVLPILLIFILLFICILLSFVTKTSFGFNFLYLIHFNFGKEQRQKIDALSGDNLNKLLKAMKRPQVQEIKFVTGKSKEKLAANCDNKAAGDGIAIEGSQSKVRETKPGKKLVKEKKLEKVSGVDVDGETLDVTVENSDCSLDDSRLIEDCKS